MSITCGSFKIHSVSHRRLALSEESKGLTHSNNVLNPRSLSPGNRDHIPTVSSVQNLNRIYLSLVMGMNTTMVSPFNICTKSHWSAVNVALLKHFPPCGTWPHTQIKERFLLNRFQLKHQDKLNYLC